MIASILERWPADFRIRVSYEVRGRELVSDIEYENTGDGPLPCGFGTHAYFRLPLSEGGNVADTVVDRARDAVLGSGADDPDRATASSRVATNNLPTGCGWATTNSTRASQACAPTATAWCARD